MILNNRITTAANTAQTARQRTEWLVPRGILFQVDIVFPPGPGGLLRLRILRGSDPFVPAQDEQFIRADNIHLTLKTHLVMDTYPTLLSVETFNLDTAYPHDVDITVSIATSNSERMLYEPERFIAALLIGTSPETVDPNVALARVQKDLATLFGEDNSE